MIVLWIAESIRLCGAGTLALALCAASTHEAPGPGQTVERKAPAKTALRPSAQPILKLQGVLSSYCCLVGFKA